MAGTEDLLFHDVTFTIFTGPTISSDEEQRVRSFRLRTSLHFQDADRLLTVDPPLDKRRSDLHLPKRRRLD
jgi:hypothetical protein